MNKQNFLNGNSKYPVSTDTLNFLQDQILFLQALTALYGDTYIIKQSSATTDGIIVLAGEIMPLKGTPAAYLGIIERNEDITAKGETFTNARTYRHAQYSSGGDIATADIALIKSISTLATDFVKQGQHLPPKSSLIQYASDNFSLCTTDIFGWVPCGTYMDNAPTFHVDAEINYLEAAYASVGYIKEDVPSLSSDPRANLRITQVNGVTIPDIDPSANEYRQLIKVI